MTRINYAYEYSLKNVPDPILFLKCVCALHRLCSKNIKCSSTKKMNASVWDKDK